MMASGTQPPNIEVAVSDAQGCLPLDAVGLEELVRRVLRGEGVERAEISLVLVDDATIHELNRRHLGHDWPTDVITFPLSEPGSDELAGEVVVSAQTAAATAARAGAEARDELALYVVHGLLHLCGYDDHSAEDRQNMRRREDEILAREGLTNTFPLVPPSEGADEERGSVRWAV